MPTITVSAYAPPTAAGSGVSLSLRETKAGQYFYLSLTLAAQTELFGRALNPEKDGLALTVNSDAGKTHLLVVDRVAASDERGVPVTASTRGSVACRTMPWRAVAPGKRPGKAMPVVTRQGDRVALKLPEWARPDPVKIGRDKGMT